MSATHIFAWLLLIYGVIGTIAEIQLRRRVRRIERQMNEVLRRYLEREK